MWLRCKGPMRAWALLSTIAGLLYQVTMRKGGPPRRVRDPRRGLRWARVAVWLARALVLSLLVFQSALIEVVVHHDMSAQCDDDDRSCGCPTNCHCCVSCAHQGTPALPGMGPVLSFFESDFVKLPESRGVEALSSVDRGPPAKVPKRAS